MSRDFFDFIFNENDNTNVIHGKKINDLIIVTERNNYIKEWINLLNSLKINYLIFVKDLQKQQFNNNVIENKKMKIHNYNYWTFIFNNFPSFCYLTIGLIDTPENFEIMYYEYMQNHYNLMINPSDNNKFINKIFNNKINKNIEYFSDQYRLFNSAYLKYNLKNKKSIDFINNLDYHKNKDGILFSNSYFGGTENKPTPYKIRFLIFCLIKKYSLSFSIIILALGIILSMFVFNNIEMVKKFSIIAGSITGVILLIDLIKKEVY